MPAYSLLTLAEIEVRLLERLDHHRFYTTLDRRDALRMALLLWQAFTGLWVGPTTVTTIPDDPYVPVPDLTQILAVARGVVPLTATTLEDLSYVRPNWRKETGTPRYWAPIGMTAMALWPVPDAAYVLTPTGLITGVPQPTFSGAAVVDFPPEWVGPLLDLTAWWMAGKATPVEQRKYDEALARAGAALTAQGALRDRARPMQALFQALVGSRQRQHDGGA